MLADDSLRQFLLGHPNGFHEIISIDYGLLQGSAEANDEAVARGCADQNFDATATFDGNVSQVMAFGCWRTAAHMDTDKPSFFKPSKMSATYRRSMQTPPHQNCVSGLSTGKFDSNHSLPAGVSGVRMQIEPWSRKRKSGWMLLEVDCCTTLQLAMDASVVGVCGSRPRFGVISTSLGRVLLLGLLQSCVNETSNLLCHP
jgi:hypothetical protein